MAIKFPKSSAAAKLRILSQPRADGGRFGKKTFPSSVTPAANVDISSQFVAIPNPISGVFYNPDEFWRENNENASRCLLDLVVKSSLEERALITAELPFSILPDDAEDPEQEEAADEITKVVRRTPYLTDLLRFLNESAIWLGRGAAYFDYKWDFSTGQRQMIVNKWVPVHGDSLLMTEDGLGGYRVGVDKQPKHPFVCIEGRGEAITEQERSAWIVNAANRTAGEFRRFTEAGAMFGLGVRNYVGPVWLIKQELLRQIVNASQKVGDGHLIYYFELGNQASQEAVYQMAVKQADSIIKLFPRSAGGNPAEGVESLDPPSGFGDLLTIYSELNKQIRLAIVGSELTATAGPTGLGSNLADVHQNTLGRRCLYDSLNLQQALSRDFVQVLQKHNGYGHLPPLRWEFSFDLGDIDKKLARAKTLDDMGVEIATDEVRQSAGFTQPMEEEQTTDET